MTKISLMWLLLIWPDQVATSASIQNPSIPPRPAGGNRPTLRCGAEALFFGLKWLDLPVQNFQALEAKLGQPSELGYSMAELEAAAKQFGATTLGVQTTLENLARRPESVVKIARMRSGHFVSIIDERDGMVYFVNPPAREDHVPRATFNQLWDRKVLLLSTSPLVREEDLPRPIPWALILAVGSGLVVTMLALLWGKRSTTMVHAPTTVTG